MEFEVAKEKAVKYLMTAKKTEYEVKQKLKKSNFSDEVIYQVTKYLKELGYINDEDYIDAYIRQCMRLLTYSGFEIKQKLLQKGIKKDIIEKKLEILKNTDYEKRLIEKLINGKLKNMDELDRKKYLYRRGLGNFDDIYGE